MSIGQVCQTATWNFASKHYGGNFGPRTRRHYSVFRIAWESLKRSDPDCTHSALFNAFLHPPDAFFDNMRIPP